MEGPTEEARDGLDRGGLDLGDLLAMGGGMAACVVAGFGLGWLVDLFVDSFPGFALAGLGLGIVAACWYVWSILKRFS
ncbi:MAG: AtpZ/AtpI family protein [Pseudonocardia sp.]|nr:AtpZ/AtpI family protein [Pseudonocardia sp.]